MTKALNDVPSVPLHMALDGAAWTIPQFCQYYQISRGTYYRLRAKGLAPKETIFNAHCIRILGEARRTWEANLRPTVAAQFGVTSRPPAQSTSGATPG